MWMMLLLLLSKMFYSVRLMFKTARMRKIRIVTLDEYISPTVSALHEQGLVQINEISDSIQQDPELAELVTPSKASAFTGKLSSLLMKTSAISELLGNSLSEGHGIKDTIKSFISPEMPIQKEVGDLDTEALINKAEDLLAQVESETKVIEGKFSALDSETSVLTSNKSLAKRLYNLDMDLALLKDSKYTSITVGRINAESASEIESNLSKLTDELDVFIVPNDDKETANIIVVTLKEFGEDVYSTLRKFDFERVEVSNVKGTPQQIISSADSRLVTIESERNSAKSDLKAIAERWDDDILSLKEELENEKEKNEILAAFVQTKDTYMLEAWVPVKDTDKVEQLVEKSSDGHCTFELIDVEGTDDEDVPILQTNKGYVKPYEVLVDMYSPVRYNAIDPTFFVAVVFPFLFGYCLTDAFYGAIVAIIGVVLVRGMGKLNDTMKSFGYILTACGIWAIILGLLTNGLLGDFTERMLNYKLPTVVPAVEAFVHPDTILIIAIAVPCFADSGTYNQSFYYKAWNGSGGYMNVYSTSGPYSGAPIKTWATNAEPDQIWDRYNHVGPYYFTLRARANNAYAINRSSTNGYTILWPIDTGYNDSLFYDPVSQPEYLAAYPETGYLLAASSAQSGAQIYFGANQGLNASWVVRVAPSK